MNSCTFVDNKWVTAIKVVYVSRAGGGGEGGGRLCKKPQNGQLKSF